MAVVRATYRALLREARRLTRASECLRLAQPINVALWGTGELTQASSHDAQQLQTQLFPGVDFAAAGAAEQSVFSGASCRRVIQAQFRRADPNPVAHRLDAGFAHLATINRLREADASTTVTRTRVGDDVLVDVALSTAFVRAASASEMASLGAFPFAYRLRIHNSGVHPVQLLGRHWQFRDASGALIMEVARGSPGVVGHSPVLPPGAAFMYTSGAQLPTPRGSMQGAFQMVVLSSGEQFDARVARTPLLSGTVGEAAARPFSLQPASRQADGSAHKSR